MTNAAPHFGNIFSLAGEHALITGGGTGLGLAMAQSFIAAGARVTMVGRRREPLQTACNELGPNAAYLAADITDPKQINRLIPEVESQSGPLSILVNNAGVHLKKPATVTTDEEFQSVIQTHLFAAFSLSREASKGMLERGRGSILFTASMTSFIGMTQVVAYSAAKSAYLGVVRALAAEWSSKGLRVNAIAPGWIQSEMLEKALAGDSARRAKIISRTPMGRMGEPHDIGWAAVYLCSPAAKFVTGVVLPIDGGASIGF
jgi:gluconate 5-dehydrogenase